MDKRYMHVKVVHAHKNGNLNSFCHDLDTRTWTGETMQ